MANFGKPGRHAIMSSKSITGYDAMTDNFAVAVAMPKATAQTKVQSTMAINAVAYDSTATAKSNAVKVVAAAAMFVVPIAIALVSGGIGVL